MKYNISATVSNIIILLFLILSMIDIILQDFCEVVGMYDDTTSPHSRAYFRKTLPDGGEDLVETGTCSKEEIERRPRLLPRNYRSR